MKRSETPAYFVNNKSNPEGVTEFSPPYSVTPSGFKIPPHLQAGVSLRSTACLYSAAPSALVQRFPRFSPPVRGTPRPYIAKRWPTTCGGKGNASWPAGGRRRWSWWESNPRPNKETARFLHAYSRLHFRATARPGPPTGALSSKISSRWRGTP